MKAELAVNIFLCLALTTFLFLVAICLVAMLSQSLDK